MTLAIDASRTVVAQRTGTERYSLELLRGLCALAEPGELALYFNQPPPPGLFPPASSCRLRSIPQRRLWTHLRLARALRQDRPALLFVPAHVLPLVHPRRTVVTVHDLGFRFFPAAHPPAARAYLELSTWWAARRATRLIAISRATAADLQRCYGVPPERIRVIYEGVDPAFRPFHDPDALAAFRRRHALGPEPYVLAVGTLQPRKNLPTLLRAFRRFQDSQPDRYQLLLAGRPGWGGGAGPLLAEATHLGLANQVKFVGYLPDADLPLAYSGALAYVQPSLYEGFGLSVLEALACGTPVVAADRAALPEIVGQAGLLFDPTSPADLATSLAQLLPGTPLRAHLQSAGPAQAAHFTWQRCAQQTLALLREVAQSP